MSLSERITAMDDTRKQSNILLTQAGKHIRTCKDITQQRREGMAVHLLSTSGGFYKAQPVLETRPEAGL